MLIIKLSLDVSLINVILIAEIKTVFPLAISLSTHHILKQKFWLFANSH